MSNIKNMAFESEMILPNGKDQKDLKNIFFTKCNFKDVIFENFGFSNIKFCDCVFQGCTFKNCNFNNVELESCIAEGSNSFFQCFCFGFFVKHTNIFSLSAFDNIFKKISFEDNKVYSLKFKSNFCTNFNVKRNFFNGVKSKSNMFKSAIFAENHRRNFACLLNFYDTLSNFSNEDLTKIKDITDKTLPSYCYASFNKTKGKTFLIGGGVCPVEGSFIGYKKCSCYDDFHVRKNCVVVLKICEDAMRFGDKRTKKCRCSKAEVIRIETLDGSNDKITKAFSFFDPNFLYEVGKIVEPDMFDEDEDKICGNGIHFFMDRIQAIDYLF